MTRSSQEIRVKIPKRIQPFTNTPLLCSPIFRSLMNERSIQRDAPAGNSSETGLLNEGSEIIEKVYKAIRNREEISRGAKG